MDIWHLTITYDGADWLIQSWTGKDAHSLGLGDWKLIRQVDGAEDAIADDLSLELLGRALLERVMKFMDRLALELLSDKPATPPLPF
jgi:hypothetical protein